MEIQIFDTKVRIVKKEGEEDFICLTDLARYKNADKPDEVIRTWLNTRREIEFLKEWESFYNKDFKLVESADFQGYKNYVVDVFVPNKSSINKWIAYTNAQGIYSKRGRNGGTYAHSTIALNFANYINAGFYVRVLEEYQVLKKQQATLLGDPLDIKRHLTAGNYSVLVASIFSQLDERLLSLPQPQKSKSVFQSEADMLNEIVFKTSAKEWRIVNAEKPANKNMRDYASILDLVVLNNLQFLDSMLIQWECTKEERQKFLTDAYDFQYPILKRSATIKNLQEMADKANKII